MTGLNLENLTKSERYERIVLLIEQAEAEIDRLREEGSELEKDILKAIDVQKHRKVLNFIKSLPNNR